MNNLIIGLGGIGGRILRELRKRMFDEELLGEGQQQTSTAFMYIDSTDELMRPDDPNWQTLDGFNARFNHSEFLNINAFDMRQVATALESFPMLRGIVEGYHGLERYQQGYGAMQDRRLGRIMLTANSAAFLHMMQAKVHELQEQTGMAGGLNVYVVTSLMGGTGSGIVVDVIAQTYKLYPKAHVFVMAVLPKNPPLHYDHGYFLANTYAALKELNALNIGKFHPIDISGNPGERVDVISRERLQFTLIPFESGSYFENRPVSDLLFELLEIDHRHDFVSEILWRRLTFYAHGDYWLQYENEYNAAIDEPEPSHTKALAAIELYRLVYPRKQILYYMAYRTISIAIDKQIYQLSPSSMEMIVNENLRKWHLDHESLTLQRPYGMGNERDVQPFREYWNSHLSLFASEVTKMRGDEGMAGLRRMADALFQHNFRRMSSVMEYFQNKHHSIRDYVYHIMFGIEQDLCQQWFHGELNLVQLQHICNAIVAYLKEEREKVERDIVAYREKTDEAEKHCNKLYEEYINSNIIIRTIKKHEYLRRMTDVLVEHFTCHTEAVALVFKKDLLAELHVAMQHAANRLENIRMKMKEMSWQASEMMSQLSNYNNSTAIDLRNQKDIELYMLSQQKTQTAGTNHFHDGITKAMRNHLSEMVGEGMSFRNMEKYLRKDTLTSFAKFAAMEIEMYDAGQPRIMTDIDHTEYHNPLKATVYSNLGGQSKEEVHRFVHERLGNICETLNLDQAELTRAVPYNSPDPAQGATTIIVRLPVPSIDEEEALRAELINTFRSAGIGIDICEAGHSDEITITKICSLFPIRAIASLPKLKEQYDQRMSENAEQAFGRLHTEKACQNLPSLETE